MQRWAFCVVVPLSYICNPMSLENLRNLTVLPYITWRLILDSKIRRKESQGLRFFTGQTSQISKLRKRSHSKWKPEKYQLTKFYQTAVKDFKSKRKQFHMDKLQRKKKILVVRLIASKNRKSKSSNSSIWDELKFESNKFITSGMDKGNRKMMWQIRITRL